MSYIQINLWKITMIIFLNYTPNFTQIAQNILSDFTWVPSSSHHPKIPHLPHLPLTNPTTVGFLTALLPLPSFTPLPFLPFHSHPFTPSLSHKYTVSLPILTINKYEYTPCHLLRSPLFMDNNPIPLSQFDSQSLISLTLHSNHLIITIL